MFRALVPVCCPAAARSINRATRRRCLAIICRPALQILQAAIACWRDASNAFSPPGGFCRGFQRNLDRRVAGGTAFGTRAAIKPRPSCSAQFGPAGCSAHTASPDKKHEDHDHDAVNLSRVARGMAAQFPSTGRNSFSQLEGPAGKDGCQPSPFLWRGAVRHSPRHPPPLAALKPLIPLQAASLALRPVFAPPAARRACLSLRSSPRTMVVAVERIGLRVSMRARPLSLARLRRYTSRQHGAARGLEIERSVSFRSNDPWLRLSFPRWSKSAIPPDSMWHYLNENGPALTQLAKDIDAPRGVIMQAVGWLARERQSRDRRRSPQEAGRASQLRPARRPLPFVH